MSRLSEREIARKLAERDDFEPPAGLLEKIKNEIPPAVAVGTETSGERRSTMPSRQRWLIAASLVAMIGAGLFALRLRQQAPALESAVAPQSHPAAAAPKTEERESDALKPSAPVQQSAAEQNEMRPSAAIPPPPPPPSKPDLEAVRRLKSLGYLGNRRDQVAAPAEVPELVEGGVEGGVVGGVAGGVAGGVPAAVPSPVAPPPPPAAVAAPKPSRKAVVESPLLEERRISTDATVAQSELEKIPTARDPWAVLQTNPGVLTDRINVGGNESGQQSRYVGPGSPEPPARAEDFFKSAAVNPFVETAKDRLSTFGLDVDTASYTVARQFLTNGQMPVPASVRVEEYVNFFDYGDAPPTRGDFAIKAEGGPTPFTQGPQYRLLRFNLRGREVRMDNRRPVVLTFLIDVSGSMDQPNRLGLVKQSLSLLLDQLRPTDRIGLVIFGSTAWVLLEPTSDREAVRQAIGKLATEGATNLEEGLKVAYEVAGRNLRPNASNRVILCSDGEANVGHAGPQAILGQIGREARRGIELTTLGFGIGDYNDNLMEQLADKGDGRNAYIDTLEEAKRVLVEEVSGTLNTIAKDAKVQVELNPAVVARYRLLGYENRAIADERFRDNRVIAGQIGSGHSVTALYEVELRPDAPRDGVVATLRLRYHSPEIGNVTETERRLRLSELASTWKKASPGFRLAALVAQFAEILKGSPWAKGDLADIARQLQAVAKALPKSAASARFTELADLAEKAARLKAAEHPER
jgi:Ca-activated chloride channel family protein